METVEAVPHDPFSRVRLRILLAWLAVTGVLLAVAAALLIGPRLAELTGPGVLVASVWFYGVVAIWIALEFPRAGLDWRRLFGPRLEPRRLAESAFAAGLHLLFSGNAFIALLVIVSVFSPAFVQAQLDHPERLAGGLDKMPPWFLAPLTVLVAPIVEELMFRGLLFHRFARRWGVRRAALVTSAIFAVMHLNPVGIFALGLLLTVLYLKTGSLWAPIACHALNNAVAAAFAILSWHGPGAATPAPSLSVHQLRADLPPVLIGLAAVTSVLVVYLVSNWPRADQPPPYVANAPTEHA